MAQSKYDETFISGVNAEYIAHLYTQYLINPANVDASWNSFFKGLNDNEVTFLKELSGASWTPEENTLKARKFGSAALKAADGIVVEAEDRHSVLTDAGHFCSTEARQAALDSIRALMLIRAYRFRGHFLANLDPLGMKQPKSHPELTPEYYGFTDRDYDRPIYIDGMLGMECGTLREIIGALREIYTGTVGVEYMHLSDPKERAWIQDRIEEIRNKTEFTHRGKRAILERLTVAEGFETYLHKKHPGTKRFGVDGGEALIPAIEQIMKRGGQLGLKEIVVGMAHRGRLNVLANVMCKPYTTIFAEFQGQSSLPTDALGSGDVKYHLGASSDRDFDGNNVHLFLMANPSHLEFVNPVVIGKVRARQIWRKDMEAKEVMPLLLHGDAAFAGQGVIAETLMISDLPGYRVGGTVHIVINNQIGFTTMPKFSRSGPYCTDVVKMLDAPIFHVNGDDAEAVVHVARVATEFRQKFRKDVVIDIFCYRRHGHNEGDEPAFTQPLMYQKIAHHDTARTKYAAQLIAEGVVTKDEVTRMENDFIQVLDESFEAVKSFRPNASEFMGEAWKGLKAAYGEERRGCTGVDKVDLKRIGKVITRLPEDFPLNKKLVRVIENRRQMFEAEDGFDWATAEFMAFGSLLNDGYAVRFSGQDVGRGTFSQRHAIWYNQENEWKYVPLKHIKSGQPRYEVHDSPLSELAVLGFEYGYSTADPNTLTIWEAQFGDFANGAQVIIDQFISSAESKWLRMSGLVMLLPHGFEGQGPEHSSARLERFLQLSGDDNWQICNCTTPANYFHVLRRQMHRDFRKPLVVMTPKSLLRHKLVTSPLEAFVDGTSFHRVFGEIEPENLIQPEKIRRVVVCSGKIYYDLLQARREREIKDVAIIRVEQLYPFPGKRLAQEFKQFENADIVWCQEEPENQGAWSYIDRRIEGVLTSLDHQAQRPRYVGRSASSSPATGLLSRHQEEQAALVDEALTL
ncbi:MAG: 2-oxoglutarate dehydrogenase E1 component [Alphaproteobacteria bacterium]